MNKKMIEQVKEQTVEVDGFVAVDMQGIKVPVIAVFESPVDYPDRCVARLFDGANATNIVLLGETVEELRGDIHFNFPGMIPFGRGANDVEALVECWI